MGDRDEPGTHSGSISPCWFCGHVVMPVSVAGFGAPPANRLGRLMVSSRVEGCNKKF